jgi:hypothetical protein
MTSAKLLKNSFRGWLPQETSAKGSQNLSNSRWKRPVWMITVILVITLVFSITFTLFSSAVSDTNMAIRYTNAQNDLVYLGCSKISNMTVPKVGDVFEVAVNVTWLCSELSEFERKVELIDPYPENNCRLIDGNNVVHCSGNGGEAQIMYLLEVIDDNSETFMLSNPFTAIYIDGIEIQHRTMPH